MITLKGGDCDWFSPERVFAVIVSGISAPSVSAFIRNGVFLVQVVVGY